MEYLTWFISIFILIFELMGAIMIVYGGVRAAIGVVLIEVIHRTNIYYNTVRIDFTNKLIFGLEFIIAADVLATILAPSIEDVLLLGAIVAIRTVLSHFLLKEATDYTMNDVFLLKNE
ncbi:hypothetical protein RJ53_01380 [Methanocalculus chunghsingensis]|uniref:DUF1622 domain-containing protein n=1 Tax=Methanocalculus chunghsingensis TaxID=156457 RepID=A0A8J8B406_9EURY|nr:DUF1622 domain-containing protein [Methanocalculus chunghsingensis]MBR1368216.1 hypothetical protein [Methanocalculus chunghsingensis]